MKIIIFALGTRGDIQPYLALAVGLQRAGHQATLVAPRGFTDWIESHGIATQPVHFDWREILQQPENQAILKGRNVLRQWHLFYNAIQTGTRAALEDLWQVAQSADFVVQTAMGLGGVEIASQRTIPLALAFLHPLVPTHAFPSVFWPTRASRWGYNYLTHKLMLQATWFTFGGPALNQWRAARFNLPPWRSFGEMFNTCRQMGAPWLFGYSSNVLPKPIEWDDTHHVTGYWFLDGLPDWQPPADLLRFLESGQPPVYIGFGSMHNEDPERLTRLTLRALEMTGQRGVLASGWGGITEFASSSQMYFLNNVPHEWLFPRMAAVVHHGGAGTTAASLRTGVPSIITPFGLDQFAWADLVARLGVGPRVGDVKKLTAEKLAAAISTAITDSSLRARAAALGEKIRAENGVDRAVEIIERQAIQFRKQ